MRGVTKAFGANVANDAISLTLRRGEVLGLLGENGAGKSTLMKILYGLYQADEGTILVDGREVAIDGPRDAVALGIGMVHQHFLLVPTLTVAENVVLGAEPGGRGRLDLGAAQRLVTEVGERYGLTVPPAAMVGDLSVGLRQRIEIIKALSRDARILVLDEPTAVLTPQEATELFGVLRSLVADGLSVILITHKLGELLGTSDRIVVIRDGKVVDEVASDQTDERELARLMVGRDVVLQVERSSKEAGDVRLAVRDLEVRSSAGEQAVRGVSLDVRAGEVLGIAGVDGNGQVELVEAIAGIRPLVAGTVHLDEDDVTGAGADARRARGLAHIPEDRDSKGLVGDFTLAENLALTRHDQEPFARGGWLRRAARREHAAEVLRRWDVRPPNPDAHASSLSGGNQQKAVVARELSGDPGIILASQPTRGVDVGAIEYIHARLLEARDAGAAILLVSLELDEIHALADRILVLAGGRIVGETSAEDATDEQLGLWMAGGSGHGELTEAVAEG